MTIENNKVVSIDYVVKDEQGETMDASEEGAPLVYLHGFQNVIPGLENALNNKKVGDKLTAEIAPADAYGDYQEQAVQQVPMGAFEGVENIEPGMAFTAQTEQGPVNIIVTGVEGDTVTVDGNHPLAGKTLTFEVEVKDVRDATQEELDHGHVHGEGGHQH